MGLAGTSSIPPGYKEPKHMVAVESLPARARNSISEVFHTFLLNYPVYEVAAESSTGRLFKL